MTGGAWSLVAAFVGGLGLFLLGMRLMSDGLKLAAGRMLRDLLRGWTRTRFRGLLAGILITAIVQSSSAVTVATIGFVNAGVLDLGRALWVVFGSNVGTTVTAWLVAATGFEVNLEALALPMIGVGVLLDLTGVRTRRGAMGKAITGFGLFFLGLQVLKGAFASLGQSADLASFQAGGVTGGLVFFAIGTLLTVIMQSSSAALALTLTAASQGIIDVNAAGAMVVGANLGTTSTAIFASIGATPAARRTAVGHVVFNLVAAAAALALLPWMLDALVAAYSITGASPGVGTVLALFHTSFNLLGVLLMWPITGRLVRALEKRFITEEEKKGEPRYLDPNVLSVPAVALDALTLEMTRMGRHATEIVALALRAPEPDGASIARRVEGFERLMEAIGSAFTHLDRAQLSEVTAQGLARLIRVSRHYLTAIEQAQLLVEIREEALAERASGARFDGPLGDALRSSVALANPEREGFSLAAAEESLGVLQERYDKDRAALLDDAALGKEAARPAMTAYHLLSEARRAARHLVRAAEDLESLRGAEGRRVSVPPKAQREDESSDRDATPE